jgi:hypothetical protein
MKKTDEISGPSSCINRALDDELVFVLLGRDPVAPDIIRYWCKCRVGQGLNTWRDPKIKEALALADAMDADRDLLRFQLSRMGTLNSSLPPPTTPQ